MDPIAEIKRLYYEATKATIQEDLYRAIDLLKTLPDEAARERVAVYMDGLAQMRSEWSASGRAKTGELRREPAEADSGRGGGAQAARGGVASSPSQASRPTGSSRFASAPRGGAARGRSGRSTASSRRHR